MQFLATIPALAWLIGSGLFFAIGEFFSKKWSLAPSWITAALIFLAYNIGTMFWLPAILKEKELARIGVVWSLLSVIATVGIGVLVFRERLTALQALGIILALIALALIES